MWQWKCECVFLPSRRFTATHGCSIKWESRGTLPRSPVSVISLRCSGFLAKSAILSASLGLLSICSVTQTFNFFFNGLHHCLQEQVKQVEKKKKGCIPVQLQSERLNHYLIPTALTIFAENKIQKSTPSESMPPLFGDNFSVRCIHTC